MSKTIIEMFSKLKMTGSASFCEGLGEKIQINEEVLIRILEEEWQVRQDRAQALRLRQAKFPLVKEWSELDPKLNPKIDFSQLEKYFDGHFVEQKQNLCLMGLQGTGKTHSLIALGRELCRKGVSVKFYTACELTNLLEESKRELTLSKVMKRLKKPKLLILDELGFVPFSDNGARLLFEVFASRYETGSIAVSTNLSFDKWVQVFGSVELTAALVDRFTHKTDIINFFEGRSIRNVQARSRMKSNKIKLTAHNGRYA